jgi:hypothetical protein
MLLLLLSLATAAPPAAPALQPGDLVFHRSTSRQSEAIARATHSPLTHVGVVLEHEGTLQVFEAVQPVGWAAVDVWIARGAPDTLLVKRLRDADAVLVPATLARMAALAATWEGRSYDAAFAWSDEQLYCSELVHKLYARAASVELGALQRLVDFDLADPTVATALRARYGDRPPLQEVVLSPAALAADPRLVDVR